MRRFCARNIIVDFISRLSSSNFTNSALDCSIEVRHHNEKYTDCEATFADYCAIQSVDSLSNQHSTNTSPPHPHRTSQDTDRTYSPMHPDRKSSHISKSTLEEPHRLRIYLSTSCPDRTIHHCCFSYPLAVPCSHQSGPLLSHLQERIYH
jgi:hypothetical protein